MSAVSPSEQQLKALVSERRRIRLFGVERPPRRSENGADCERMEPDGEGGHGWEQREGQGALTNHVGEERTGSLETPPGPQPRVPSPLELAQNHAQHRGEGEEGRGPELQDANAGAPAQSRTPPLVLAADVVFGHQESDEHGRSDRFSLVAHAPHRRNSSGLLESAISAGPPTPPTKKTAAGGGAQGSLTAAAAGAKRRGSSFSAGGSAPGVEEPSALSGMDDEKSGASVPQQWDGDGEEDPEESFVDIEGIVKMLPANSLRGKKFGRSSSTAQGKGAAEFGLPGEKPRRSMSGIITFEPPPRSGQTRSSSNQGHLHTRTFDEDECGIATRSPISSSYEDDVRNLRRSSPINSPPNGAFTPTSPRTSPRMRTMTNRLAVESIKSGNMDDIMIANLQEKALRASRMSANFSSSNRSISASSDRISPNSQRTSSISPRRNGFLSMGLLPPPPPPPHELASPRKFQSGELSLTGHGFVMGSSAGRVSEELQNKTPLIFESGIFQLPPDDCQETSTRSLHSVLGGGSVEPVVSSKGSLINSQQGGANPHGTFPPHIKALFSRPASSVTSAFNVHRVKLDTTILDTMRILADTETVIVDGWLDGDSGESAKDLIWNRSGFLEVAAGVEDPTMPVSHIVEEVITIPTVLATDPLDVVWRCMVAMGVDQVGTLSDDGRVTGVVLFFDLYKLVFEETESRAPDEYRKWGIGDRTFNKLGEMDPEANGRAQGVGIIQDLAFNWSENIFTTCMSFYLLCVEVSCMTTNSPIRTSTGDFSPSVAVSGMVMSLFVLEAFVRIVAFRRKLLDGSMPLETLDQIVTWSALVVFVLGISAVLSANVMRGAILFRGIRALRIVKLGNRVRKLVGRDRRRYTKNGFDLDLTYVTPGVIAMSIPSAGSATNYRNPVHEVARFFNTIHKDKYHIFNLCPERNYDLTLFHGRVSKIKVQDHNPVTITDLVNFVEKVESFIESDPDCVIAVHCKGGKGRTGTAISTWLLYSKFCETADEAMKWFARGRALDPELLPISQRTSGKDAKIKQGVTGMSQQRYVRYMEQIFNEGGYHSKRLILDRLVIHTTMKMDSDGGCDPWFLIEENCHEVYDWRKGRKTIDNMKKGTEIKEFELRELSPDGQIGKGVPLVGDVRISVYDHDTMRERIACYFWFHTGFIVDNYLCLTKSDIDMAATDKHCRVFEDDFKIEMFFSNPVSKVADNFREVAPPSFRVLECARKHMMACELESPVKNTTLHPAIKAFRDQSSGIFRKSGTFKSSANLK